MPEAIKTHRLNDLKTRDIVVKKLAQRGATLKDIADIVYTLQAKYIDNLTIEMCLTHVGKVVMKREVQNAVLTGIELDRLAEEGHIEEPLKSMLLGDNGLYGVDEVLALAIVNVYGSIGFRNFGYVDKIKPGIIKTIDDAGKEDGRCNTFLDDIVGAIASAAASSVAHRYALK